MRNRVFLFAIAIAGFVAALLSAPSIAADEPASVDTAPPVAGTPQIVSIDNVLLYRRLTRLGMTSQRLGYVLAISAEGDVTDCELDRKFRSPFTTKQICRALTQAIVFAPARDLQGTAVDSTFEGELDVLTFFRSDR